MNVAEQGQGDDDSIFSVASNGTIVRASSPLGASTYFARDWSAK